MKKKLWIINLLALVLLFSCVDDSYITPSDTAKSSELENTGTIEGMIRIKLTQEAEKTISRAKSSEGTVQTGINDFDELMKSLGASKMERTFRHGGKFEKRRREAGLHLWYDVYFDKPTTSTRRACQRVENLKGIALVEPVYEIELGNYTVIDPSKAKQLIASQQVMKNRARNTSFFNDPGLPKQWNYDNNGTIDEYFIQGSDINLFNAWEIETGSPDIIVAIVDTGVDFSHEDLADNMWVNEAEKNGSPGVDNDNNGYVDDLYGWNFVSDSEEIIPGEHGTHVAGVIAAVNNNGIGICGVAGGDGTGNGVRLMSCQIGTTGAVGGKYAPDAYAYAADNGAVICQNSWGHNSSVQKLPESSKVAIDYFINYAGRNENGVQVGPIDGGIVIFAAGNNGVEGVIMPAAYSEVLSVTGMGINYQKASYSSYGDWVDVTAPGGNYRTEPYTIYSTTPDNTYSFMQGTSMAAPHVSGIAALMASKFAKEKISVTGQDIHRIIKATANNKNGEFYSLYNPLYAGKLGTGYVDAYKALTGGRDNGTSPVPSKKVDFECYNQMLYVNVTVTANDIGYIPSRYEVFISSRDLHNENLDKPASDVTVRTLRTEVFNDGDITTQQITNLKPDTKYYVAVRPWNMTGGTIAPGYYETHTVNTDGPDEITDLKVRWVNNVMELKWSVTSDPDDDKPILYNLYYSTSDHQATKSGISPDSEVEILNVENKSVGDELLVALRHLAPNTSYYFAIQSVDIRTNVSPITYYHKLTGANSAPKTTSTPLPAVNFSTKGESKTLDMKNYFTNDDTFGLSYEVTSTDNSLQFTVSGDEVTLTLAKDTPGKGDFTVTAKDYEGLTASATAKFSLTSSITGENHIVLSFFQDKKELYITSKVSISSMDIKVYDSMGARVHSEVLRDIEADSTKKIDLSKLVGGTYSVIIKYNGFTKKYNIISK